MTRPPYRSLDGPCDEVAKSSTGAGAPAVDDRAADRKTTTPLVSVVIPTYNAEAHLSATLVSVINQTYGHLEILVVDDGSSDRSAEIVRDFMARDPRVSLLQQPNAGVAQARNYGIRMAGGSLIAPLDADDLWGPTKIERQVARFLEADDRLALVYTWSHNVDEDGRVMRLKGSRAEWEGDVFHQLIETNLVGNGSNPLMRRDRVLDAGGYDPKLRAQGAEGCEDWKLYLRLAERYEFAVVRECLVGYRQTPGTMSRNLWAMKRSYDLLSDDLRRRHPELPERVWRRNASFFSVWLASRDTSLFGLLGQALRADPLCFLRSTVRTELLRLPLRYTYQYILKFKPALARKLETLRRKGRRPFLDESYMGPSEKASAPRL